MKNTFILISSLILLLFSSCEQAFETGSGNFTFDDNLVAIPDTVIPPVILSGKKGICFTKKNATWPIRVSMFKPYWHYSWGNDITEYDVEGVEFVPMFWGGAVSQTGIDKMLSYKQDSLISYVLGFNEPDSENQSNVSVDKALEKWPMLESIGLPLGSPATVDTEGDWMQEFMSRATQLGLRVDFVCVHNYGGVSAQNFLDKLERIYQLYGKPIWITEFAVADWTATTPEENKFSPTQVLNFMKTVLPELESRDYIQRYAWFPFSINTSQGTSSALLDADGNLTELGQYYANFTPNEKCGEGVEVPPLAPEGNNLLINGDFENGDLDGWSTISDIKAESKYQINGTTSARMTGNSASDRQLTQKVSVESGKTYALNFTGRIHNGHGAEGDKVNDNGGELYAKIKIGEADATTLITLTEDVATSKTANFTIPDGETEITVIFMKNKDIAYVDDVEIVLVEE